MPGPPAITGEMFNWGYFIGCAMSTGSEGRGPTFAVLYPPAGFHVFNVATPWAFNDYYNNMFQPFVQFGYIPPGSLPPYPAFFRIGSTIGAGVDNYYQTRLAGTLVTFNDGSTVTIDANTFGITGTYFTWSNPLIAPSDVATYSGMHLVT